MEANEVLQRPGMWLFLKELRTIIYVTTNFCWYVTVPSATVKGDTPDRGHQSFGGHVQVVLFFCLLTLSAFCHLCMYIHQCNCVIVMTSKFISQRLSNRRAL